MNKRLIIIIGIVVFLLAGVGILLAVAVKKKNADQTPATPVLGLKKVLDEPVISPVSSFDNSAIWYFNSEGRLFRINTDGTGLSEFPLPSISAAGPLRKAMWPSSGSDFLAITGSGSSEIKNYYDSAGKIYVSLPANIQSIDWLADSKRVAYIWKSGDNLHQQLALANADGTGFQTIKDVFWPDLIVKASPDGKIVLLYRQNPRGDTNKIYSADLTTGAISTVIDSGKNISATWVSASRFVFAQTSLTSYPKLYIYDFTNHQTVDLGLNTTIDKVTSDKTGLNLYAAVPKKDGAGDIFIKTDLSTYKQETYFSAEGGSASGGETNVRATGLFLVSEQLYFINTQDQKLYTIGK